MALHGSIDSFPIADVLRLLGNTAKSGRLTLDGDRGRGSVWFDEGRMVGGDATSVSSPSDPPVATVVFDLLRFDSGSFRFEAGDELATPCEPLEVAPTIETAEQMLAEFRAVTAIIPGIETWMQLSVPLGRSHVTLDENQWSAVVAVGSGAQVGDVGDTLGLSELDALRMARDLSDVGVAEICEAPAPVIQSEPAVQPTPAAEAEVSAPDVGAEPIAAPPVDQESFVTLPTETEPLAAAAAPEPPAFVAPPVADVPESVVDFAAAPGPESENPVGAVPTAAAPPAENAGDELFTPLDPEPVAAAVDADPEPTVFAMPAADAPSSNGSASGSSMDELFGEFDPFGDSAPEGDDLFAPLPDPPVAPEPTATVPSMDLPAPPADEESLEAQMAMLSPAAAEAIAAARRSASPDGTDAEPTDDSGRGAVSNYLGQL